MIYIKSCPVANRHGRKIMFRREQEENKMELCYDGALALPSSYAVMDEAEMCYKEGGYVSRSVNWISYPIDIACTAIGLNASAIMGCAGAAIAKFAAKKIAGVARNTIIQNLLGGAAVGFLTGIVTKMSRNNIVVDLLVRCTSFGGIIGIMCDMNDRKIDGKFKSPI